MARARRDISFGLVYHLISRFVDQTWFIAGEEERRRYLQLLGRALGMSDWSCLAYAIMSNHIHLALVAGKESLASWLRRAHAPFADWINARRERIGPVFVRGPRTPEVSWERVGNVIAYIHNNPVRAGVVTAAAESPWTSHRAYLGIDAAPPWLEVTDGLRRAGFAAKDAFDEWVKNPESDRVEVERARTRALRRPTIRRLPEATPLSVNPERIVQATADALGIRVDQLRSVRRGSVERLARQVAVQCAAGTGVSGARIAGALNISQQAVSLIAQRASSSDVDDLASRVLKRLSA